MTTEPTPWSTAAHRPQRHRHPVLAPGGDLHQVGASVPVPKFANTGGTRFGAL